jgi:hypothetical protein
MSQPALSFLVFQQGKHWVAQCIEYNIATQAAGPKEIIPEIRRTVWANIVIRGRTELPGIESLPPAPEPYRRAFDAAVESEVKIEPSRTEHGGWIPLVTVRYG